MTIKRFASKHLFHLVLGALSLAAITIPAMATPELWNWTDKTALLPVRDGVALNLVSERAGSWLVSDSRRLYRFDGETVKDLTRDLRNKGLLGVSNIFSDDRQWLVTYQPLDQVQPLVWLTDGDTWIEANGRFPYAQGGLDAVGRDGVWYVRAYTKPQAGHPATWTLYRWYGAQTQAEQINLPLGNLSPLASGCVNDGGGSTLCTGVNTPIHVNGQWYFLGGTSQLKGTGNTLLQTPSTHLWNLSGNAWKEMAIPSVKFVSGVWQSEDSVLIATSDVVSNPFSTDRLWVFDGNTMREVSDQALGAGLLSMDAREIKASWNGRAWVILAGKNLVRFDGRTMTRQTPTRDLFANLASDNAGMSVFVGAASLPELGVASSPLTARLAVMEEDLTQAAQTNAPSVTNVATTVVSKVFGPRVQVTSNPGDARIGNGKTFSFDAQATDPSEIDHIDIYVNGGRVKTCFDVRCTYSQVYWTQGALTRRVQLFARAVNRRNFANDSETVSLTVDANSLATASAANPPPTAVVSSDVVPASLPWTMDLGTGIAWATWIDPNQTVLKDQPVRFNVAARASKGLNRIEVWVNGSAKDTCVFDNLVTDIRMCRLTLVATDLPNGANVFVNARVLDSRSLETWTSGTTFRRERPSVTSASAGSTGGVTVIDASANVTGPVFTASAVLEPAVASVLRGDKVTYKVKAQNNTVGLHSIEVLANGVVKRTCSFGAVVSAVPCDLSIDTGNYQAGTTITFLARAIDNRGQEIWANAKSVLVRVSDQGADSNEAPAKAGNGLSVWSWMTPAQDVIAVNETATYTVGAWSPNGLKSIEMIADGIVRKTCTFGAKGSKECSYTVTTNDFSDEHMVVMNARVTDAAGVVSWSDVRMITLKRSWNALTNPASYAQVSSNRAQGYVKNDQISFTMRGWSARGLDHIDLFVNGSKVFSCPADRCTWTTPVYDKPTLEYQVRMVDQGGQDAWSGLYGLRQK